jgi:hypothetical protein|tara:strand:+ start:120 stop:737 length:618 start_codon:yes stop_codon:yes gene_type:complete
MKTTIDLVQELRSLPDEIYENFCNQAKMVALEYPSAHGIDCFARGETIEYGFIDIVGQHIDLKPNIKADFNDPDGLYAVEHLTDVKTQGNGFKPRKDQKALFYSKQWDIKKTAAGAKQFESKAHSYILIDPICARIAVVDTGVFYRKKFRTNSARISFSVKPQDVYMIYDGIAKVIDTEVIPDPNAIFREIWRKAGDRLDSLTTV